MVDVLFSDGAARADLALLRKAALEDFVTDVSPALLAYGDVDNEAVVAPNDRFTWVCRGVDVALLRPEAEVARMGRTL